MNAQTKPLPPRYVQLKKKTGKPGAWHWVKQYEETRTTFWLITGCGNGFYANDKEVNKTTGTGTALIHLNSCGRCKTSERSFYRRRGRKNKSRKVR